MAMNVKVEKNSNENSLSLLRRFTKRVQGAGVLRKVRGERYYSRSASPNVRKKKTLKRLVKREKIDELVKLGKIVLKTRR